jgi:hypothetical protein
VRVERRCELRVEVWELVYENIVLTYENFIGDFLRKGLV